MADAPQLQVPAHNVAQAQALVPDVGPPAAAAPAIPVVQAQQPQVLVPVARIFLPAVSCPSCQYPNDYNFHFCRMCGFESVISPSCGSPCSAEHLTALDTRLEELHSLVVSSTYSKQKNSLKKSFNDFLLSLPGNKTLSNATPIDVCRFMASKDPGGRTQVHVRSCSNLGLHGFKSCTCPKRLSYNTVDSYIGKLRSIFKDLGRDGDWNSSLALGNPVASSRVKNYLKAVTAELLQAAVTPKQATPIFSSKLVHLSQHLESKMTTPGISPSYLFLFARDSAFFKTLFFSGDRGGDLSLVKTQEILRFPGNDGFLFNHVWGKTLRNGSSNVFGIRRHSNPKLCPVKAIELYVSISSQLSIDLSCGYLFGPTTPRGHVSNTQLTSSAMRSRLQQYLVEAGIYEGESLHSFRAGCAITLALSGSQVSDIMHHVGWKNEATAGHYLKLAQVLRPGGPSDLLSRDSKLSNTACSSYSELNVLKGFSPAFAPTAD